MRIGHDKLQSLSNSLVRPLFKLKELLSGMNPCLISRCLLITMIGLLLAGCSARQVQDSLAGSTAQRLVTHAIDNLISALPDEDFRHLTGSRVFISSHFIENPPLRAYADQRMAIELGRRFDIQVVNSALQADQTLTVFYTSLGTDQGLLGFFLPLGFMPGVEEGTRINLITLEQFHGVAELYYYLGEHGHEQRGSRLQSRTRTDALGLPIITIPISNLP
jgi:hypothetical protein